MSLDATLIFPSLHNYTGRKRGPCFLSVFSHLTFIHVPIAIFLLPLPMLLSRLTPNFKNQIETFQSVPYLTLLKHMDHCILSEIIYISFSLYLLHVFAQRSPPSCLPTQTTQFKIATLTPSFCLSHIALLFLLHFSSFNKIIEFIYYTFVYISQVANNFTHCVHCYISTYHTK